MSRYPHRNSTAAAAAVVAAEEEEKGSYMVDCCFLFILSSLCVWCLCVFVFVLSSNLIVSKGTW